MKIKFGSYVSVALLTIFLISRSAAAQPPEAEPPKGVQRHTEKEFGLLTNQGKTSVQIIWGKNSPDSQITVTRATLQPGAVSERHTHPGEQTWIVERGSATMLLKDDKTMRIQAGDVLRTPPGETHGVFNDGKEPFVYLSITTPPEDFTAHYSEGKR